MTETLATISEAIIRRLSGGDIPADSPYKIEFVARDVRDAMREDLKMEILKKRSGEGQEDDRTDVGTYVATYRDIAVQVEPDTKRAYFQVPEVPMTLKYNKGFRLVADMRTPYKSMIPVANPSVTNNLIHSSFERDNYGYTQEGMRGYFMRDPFRDGIKKLLIQLILPAPESIGLDEPLPLIPENVARIKDMVMQRIVIRMPQDRLNDNDPNLRVTNG